MHPLIHLFTRSFTITASAGLRHITINQFTGAALLCVCCVKHYAGYDLENWHGYDRSSYNANITAQDLVETYLPPFEACVNDAKVASVMCSYKSASTHSTGCSRAQPRFTARVHNVNPEPSLV